MGLDVKVVKDQVWTTTYMEIVCTFVFVLYILYATGKRTQVVDLGTWGVPGICLNLWALTHVDYYTAASMNPGIALAQSVFQYWWYPVDQSGALLFYLPWYMLGAFGGGVLAGLFYLVFELAYPDKKDTKVNMKEIETARESINEFK